MGRHSPFSAHTSHQHIHSTGHILYHNSTRTHLPTYSSSGLEQGPYSDWAKPKIQAAKPELHNSPQSLTTFQHPPFPHTSIHRQWLPQPLVGTHLQPCEAASIFLLPSQDTPPPPPGLRGGGDALVVWATFGSPLWLGGALNI